MGRTYRIYLAGESVLMCRHCGNHLAVSEGIISKVGKTLHSETGGKPGTVFFASASLGLA